MGNVFKKTVTRPLPPNAEIITRQGVRLARWRTGKGKTKTAPLTTGTDGTNRIRDESGTYVARYRDGNGLVVEVSTGCRDKTAAQSVLADLEPRAEKVRSKILTAAEDRIADHLATPIGEHVDNYVTSLEASGASPKHVAETERVLNHVLQGCEFTTLAELEPSMVEQWLNKRRQELASARTRNVDLIRLQDAGVDRAQEERAGEPDRRTTPA